MLRRFLIAFHVAGAVLSAVLLVSTFLAKGVITAKARDHAIERSRGAADVFAARVEKVLEGKVTGVLLQGETRERLESGLSGYRADPETWLLRLFEGNLEQTPDFKVPEIGNPLARTAVDTVLKGAAGLKNHLERSYRNLILDLRIFASTNLLAFLFAAFLTWQGKTPRARHWYSGYSLLMAVAFAFSVAIYWGGAGDWGWNLLLNRHMGWFYPTMLGAITLYMVVRFTPDIFFDYWRLRKRGDL